MEKMKCYNITFTQKLSLNPISTLPKKPFNPHIALNLAISGQAEIIVAHQVFRSAHPINDHQYKRHASEHHLL